LGELRETHGEGRKMGGGSNEKDEAFTGGTGGRGKDGEGEARGERGSLEVKKIKGPEKPT